MTTFEETALKLNREILQCAIDNGAEAIVTTCPLCHFNLEGYQDRINKVSGTAINIPILYFTQLLGIALGLSPQKLGLDSSFIVLGDKIMNLAEAHYA